MRKPRKWFGSESAQTSVGQDDRVAVSLAHLRSLEFSARGFSFLPRQPATSILSGQHASRLRGRGLNEDAARGILIFGFVREVLDRVPHPALRERIIRDVVSTLPGGADLGDLTDD